MLLVHKERNSKVKQILSRLLENIFVELIIWLLKLRSHKENSPLVPCCEAIQNKITNQAPQGWVRDKKNHILCLMVGKTNSKGTLGLITFRRMPLETVSRVWLLQVYIATFSKFCPPSVLVSENPSFIALVRFFFFFFHVICGVFRAGTVPLWACVQCWPWSDSGLYQTLYDYNLYFFHPHTVLQNDLKFSLLLIPYFFIMTNTGRHLQLVNSLLRLIKWTKPPKHIMKSCFVIRTQVENYEE